MARLTIAQLTADLEALRVHCDRVETERDSLRDEVAKLKAAPQPAPAKPAYVRRGPTDEQRAAHERYVAALMAAKDLAIRTGRSVRVGE